MEPTCYRYYTDTKLLKPTLNITYYYRGLSVRNKFRKHYKDYVGSSLNYIAHELRDFKRDDVG